MKPIRYVNKRMLLTLNQMCVELSGGTSVGNGNLRGGANLGFVEQIYYNEVYGQPLYPDLFHQAGAYLFHVVKNHVFLDGNKRTGLAAALTFLQWNGVLFSPLDEDSVFDRIIEVAGGPNAPEVVVPRLAEWLREMSLY